MPLITQQDIERAAVAIVIGLGILVLRRLYFDRKLAEVNRYRDEYSCVLNTISKGGQDVQHYDRHAEIEAMLVKLFKQANEYHPLREAFDDRSRRYGAKGPTDSHVENILQSCHETIGYFRARKNETFSLTYWIETLFDWPKTAVGMLGFDRDGSAANFLKLAALIIEIVGGIYLLSLRVQ